MQKVEFHYNYCVPQVLAAHVMLQARRCLLSMKSGEAMIVVLMPSIGDWQKAIAFLLSDISARNQVFNDIEFVAKSIERKQKTAPRSRIDYFVCVLDNDLLNELINNPDITKYNYLDFRLRNVIGCLHRQREQARAAQATN